MSLSPCPCEECDIDWPQMRCPTRLAPVQSYLQKSRIIHTHDHMAMWWGHLTFILSRQYLLSGKLCLDGHLPEAHVCLPYVYTYIPMPPLFYNIGYLYVIWMGLQSSPWWSEVCLQSLLYITYTIFLSLMEWMDNQMSRPNLSLRNETPMGLDTIHCVQLLLSNKCQITFHEGNFY